MSSSVGPADFTIPWPAATAREPCGQRKLIRLPDIVHPHDREPGKYIYSCIMPEHHGGIVHMGCARGDIAVYWSTGGSTQTWARVGAGGHAFAQVQDDVTVCGCPACQGRALTCPWCGSPRVTTDLSGRHLCRNVHDDDSVEIIDIPGGIRRARRKHGVLETPCGRHFRDEHVTRHQVHRALLELGGIERDLDDP